MNALRRQLAKICLGLTALAFGGCAGPSKPFRWPWSDPDQTADLAKYGPTSKQKIEQLRAMAATAGGSDAASQERVANELAQQMRQERDPLVRCEIVLTLGSIKNPTATAVIGGALKDPDKDVRIAACQAWGKRGAPREQAFFDLNTYAYSEDPEAARLLGETLASDSDVDVRLAATKALGQIKDPKTVPFLAVALEDPNPALQLRAVESLRGASGKDFGNDVNLWREYVKNPSIEPPEQSLADRARKLF